MPAVDFGAWETPGLDLVIGGATYTVAPPSVDRMGKLLAIAVLGEVNLKIVKGPLPDEVKAVIESLDKHEHPALGPVYDQLVAAGVDQKTIDRAAFYSVYYWTHGKPYADAMAKVLRWAEDSEAAPTKEAAAPKARARSPRKSGRSTESANRSK